MSTSIINFYLRYAYVKMGKAGEMSEGYIMSMA